MESPLAKTMAPDSGRITSLGSGRHAYSKIINKNMATSPYCVINSIIKSTLGSLTLLKCITVSLNHIEDENSLLPVYFDVCREMDNMRTRIFGNKKTSLIKSLTPFNKARLHLIDDTNQTKNSMSLIKSPITSNKSRLMKSLAKS